MNLSEEQAQGRNKHIFNDRANVGSPCCASGQQQRCKVCQGKPAQRDAQLIVAPMESLAFFSCKPCGSAGGLASPAWAGAKGQAMPPQPVCKLRLHHLFSFCFCFWRISEDLSWGAVLVSPALSGYALADPNRFSQVFQVIAQAQQSSTETFPLLGSPLRGAEPTLALTVSGSRGDGSPWGALCCVPALSRLVPFSSPSFLLLPLQGCASSEVAVC